MYRAALIAALIWPAAPLAAGPPVLSLPIDCTIGDTCYIQNYTDRAPGPEARDFRCGGLTYDGHKGTDIRVATLKDMRRGVDVLAPAPGLVRGVRDGVDDVGPTNATKGRECGNGVVLRHADGWETQVCHMKSGSITVENGQMVQRGDILGQVGLSGQTEFPHVHLSVRKDGQVVDPFDISGLSSCGQSGETLWRNVPAYIAGRLLDAGFSAGIPNYDAIRAGTAGQSELNGDAAGLVIFGFGYAGRKDDEIELTITGPTGVLLAQRAKLDRDQAQYFRAAGKRLTGARWPAGEYRGSVTLWRDGRAIDRRDVAMTIR